MWDFDLLTGAAYASGPASPPDQRYTDNPELLIDDPLAAVAEEDRDTVRRAREAHWRGETAEFRAEYRYAALGPTGRIWVEAVGRLERDATGRPVRFTGVVQDITARKTAETTLAEAKATAEREAAAKDRFLSMISHELRTPLNVIVNFARLALREAPAGRVRDMMEAVVRGGDRIAAVIESILDFTALEDGQYRLDSEPFRIDEAARAALSAVEDMARAKGLEVEADIAESLAAPVLGDSLRVRKIMVNLLENAVKFTDSGRISLTARRDDAGIVIEVADTGPGVPEDLASAVFDPFRQAEIGVTRAYGGLGLSLTVATRLAALMGGSVTLARLGDAAAEAPGACFRVRLPLPAAHDSGDFERPANDEDRPLSVLVVDDNATNRKLMGVLLDGLGHSIGMAVNGVEAVSAVREGAYDVVLMDIHMPRMDGLEATRVIRTLPPPRGLTPILALTADSRADVSDQIRAAGMSGLLTKPVNPEHLKGALRRCDRALRALGVAPDTAALAGDPPGGDAPKSKPAKGSRGPRGRRD